MLNEVADEEQTDSNDVDDKDNKPSDCNNTLSKKLMLNEVTDEEQTDSSVVDDKDNGLSDCNNTVDNDSMLNEGADEEQVDSSVADNPNTFVMLLTNHPPKEETTTIQESV